MSFATKSGAKDAYLRLPLPYTAGIIVSGRLAEQVDERGELIRNKYITLNPGELVCPVASIGVKTKPNQHIMCLHPDGYIMVPWSIIWLTAGDHLFSGMVFCITGELQWTRIVYKTLIEIEGGEYKDSVTKQTTHLICANGNVNTTKSKAAQKLGKAVLTENEFLAMYRKKTHEWENSKKQ